MDCAVGAAMRALVLLEVVDLSSVATLMAACVLALLVWCSACVLLEKWDSAVAMKQWRKRHE